MKHITHGLTGFLVGLALSSVALAQAPGAFPTTGGPQMGTPFPAPRGPGAGMSRPFPQGPNGGFSSRIVFGAVQAIDPAAGTITISSQMGGNPETIKVGPDAQIVREAIVAAAELKANDQVQVTGFPTQVTASQIVAGQLPSGFPLPGRGGFGGGARRGGFGGPGTSADGASSGPTGEAYATVNARVLQANPLLLSLGNGVTITVRLAPNAKVSRIATVTLGSIKVGDELRAVEQAGADGAFTASAIGVNLDSGGFGRGGFGGGNPFGGGPGRRRGRGGNPPMPAMPMPTMPPPSAMPNMAPGTGGGSVGTQIVPNGE